MNIADDFKELCQTIPCNSGTPKVKQVEDMIRSQMNFLLCRLLDRQHTIGGKILKPTYTCIATQSTDAGDNWKVDIVWQQEPRTALSPKHKSWIIKFNQASVLPKQWQFILKPLGIQVNGKFTYCVPIDPSFLGCNIRAVMIIVGSFIDGAIMSDMNANEQDSYMFVMQSLFACIIMKMADIKIHQYHNAFVSNLAHKVRTPLNCILYMGPLLSDTPLTPTQQEYMTAVTKSSISLASVMSDTVDISRLAFNQMVLKCEVFAIKECVEEALQFITGDAILKKIKVETNIEPTTPLYIYSDYKRLRQILVILLHNSISFNNHTDGTGTVSLRVSGSMLDEPTSTQDKDTDTDNGEGRAIYYSIECSIGDNGIGMTEEQQSNVLDSFWLHLDSVTLTNSENYESSGLGLAIAQKLCQIMGGDLWLGPCALDRGSQLVFNIVAKEDEYPSYVNYTSLKTIRGKHAVVVDSDSHARIKFHNMLSKWGIKCTLVSSQDEFVSIHLNGREPIHILFINESVITQKQNGKTLLQIIREGKHEFPIVILQSTPSLRRLSTVDESTITLSAPVDDKELMTVTIDLLNHKSLPIPTEAKSIVEVLVAEDDEMNILVFRKLLPNLGYSNITFTKNGKEALSEITRNPYKYKIMLIDIRMPIMDGITLSNYVWHLYNDQLKIPDKIPFMIGVSAQPLLETDSIGKLRAFVPKPIDIKKLDDTMRMSL